MCSDASHPRRVSSGNFLTGTLFLRRIHSNRRRASIELKPKIIDRLIFPQLTDREGGRSGLLALHKMGDWVSHNWC